MTKADLLKAIANVPESADVMTSDLLPFTNVTVTEMPGRGKVIVLSDWDDEGDSSICDECGATIPPVASTAINGWHRQSCSLHSGNVVR